MSVIVAPAGSPVSGLITLSTPVSASLMLDSFMLRSSLGNYAASESCTDSVVCSLLWPEPPLPL